MENERNKETLRTAISRLPLYSPPGRVWGHVHARINGAAEAPILDTAPRFRAPTSAWDKIDEELDYQVTEKNRDQLRRALALMPAYSAPERVWTGLRGALEEGSARVRSLPQWRSAFSKIAAVAAVLLLFGISWWANTHYHHNRPVIDSERTNRPPVQLEEVEILHSGENVHPESGPETSEPDAWLRSEDPAIQTLVAQWKELTAEQQHMRETIDTYHDDPRWVLLVKDIERLRARLEKEMLKAQ